jgi:hypothetical protein
MIRRLLAGAAAASLLAFAPLAHAQHTPAPHPPVLDIMDTFKTEVAHGTLTQAQYDQLNATWQEGMNALADSAVRDVRRGPLSDPAAQQAVGNAVDDVSDAFESKDAGATVDRLLDFSQQGALAYGEPFVSLATGIVQNFLSQQQRLLVARQEMGGADPAVMLTLQHTLDKENEQATAQLNQIGSIMRTVAGMNASSLTPAQRARAVALIDNWFNAGMPPQEPANNDSAGTSGTQPSGDQPGNTGSSDTSSTDAGPSNTPSPPTAPQPNHTAANAARRPAPSGNPASPTPDTDPSLFPTRGQPPQPPQPPAQPPSEAQPPDSLPTQPPRPPTLDPVKVVMVEHPDNQAALGTYKYGADAHGGKILLEYDDPSGGVTYYGHDAQGNTVPVVYVDADGHTWATDANGHPLYDLDEDLVTSPPQGGGGGAGGGSGSSAGFGGPGRANPLMAQTVRMQTSPLDTSGYQTFAGVDNGGAYTLAKVVPIYNGWTYSQSNAGSIFQTPDNQLAGPSKAGGGGPVNDIFGPSSVMTSLSLDLSGLTLTSGLRVGTPVGQNWALPNSFIRIPSFDDLCGR